jgi:pyruvate,water dikinase
MTRAHPLILPLAHDDPQVSLVGGKGASLARLAASGLPVPRGFHVTTEAYRLFVSEGDLHALTIAAASDVKPSQPASLEAASRHIGQLFEGQGMPAAIAAAIREAYAAIGEPAVAVRSSATAEDLPGMSFAGQQETFLNIRGQAMLQGAVKRGWASLWTARAIDYRIRHRIDPGAVRLAVVVQELVPAEAAGVLFTAHPVTGARGEVHINAAWGLGEAVVSGQVTPDAIVIDKATGRVLQHKIGDKAVMTVRTDEGTRTEPVPAERRRAAVLSAEEAAELARIGARIEDVYGQPMDVEWARAGGRFFILQARPITTMETWNDSLAGDYLWTNANVGEAIPDVMTPCTWSLVERFMASTMVAPKAAGHRLWGNIGGRFYMNMSMIATMAAAVGMKRRLLQSSEQVFGRLPPGMEIPLVPVSRWRLILEMVPLAFRVKQKVRRNQKKIAEFVRGAPGRCEALHEGIRAAASGAALRSLWGSEIEPLLRTASEMLQAAGRQNGSALVMLRHDLRERVGEADANAMLTGLSPGGGELASLGPVVGLAELARGSIDRATYARRHGHRSPHEFEVSIPRPAEDPAFIDKQLAGLEALKEGPAALLARREAARAAAWRRLEERDPGRARALRKKADRWSATARDREATRSELIRVFWVLRAFVLRAGELTRRGDDLFFLSIDEILALLGGDERSLASVATRRATFDRYRSLPPYPSIIRGRFDPLRWATDPRRRSDVFDASGALPATRAVITGFPGAAGVVEGSARVLAAAEEGDQLKEGEVLVTTVTNIGWTPLFPRAAAIVTDVGAPLSHAAIVARELGIPAVVGCGDATMRLSTGDRVRVDGERGTVELLGGGSG